MKIKQLIYSCALTAFAMASFNASAGSVDVNAAQAAAGRFIQKNMPAKLRSSATPSIKLAYTEKSNVQDNAYYVFNIDGGGWVIIAGYDKAKEVLAYGTEGSIDVNAMPDNMKGYLKMLKGQIETAQAYKGETAKELGLGIVSLVAESEYVVGNDCLLEIIAVSAASRGRI